MKIRQGDIVLIIAGKNKGKQGRVLRTLVTQNRLVVEGINMRTRHMKKTPNQAGQKIVYEASIHASNVQIVDPKTKKPTRIGTKVDAKGKRVRFAKKSGEVIPAVASAKVEKKTTKKDSKDSNPSTTLGAGESKEGKKKKTEEVVADGAPPKKQPFWKRAMKSEDSEGGAVGSSGAEASTKPTSTTVRRTGES